jgi:hypothetical protein
MSIVSAFIERIRALLSNMTNAGSLVVFAIAFLAVIAIGVRMLPEDKKGRRKFRPRRNYRPDLKVVPKPGEDEALASASEQLRRVMAAEFNQRPLLNRPEAQVFKALDEAVIARNANWQVMAQVSLVEFLSSTDRGAYQCINSKRVDFALMDEECRVRHALEYQGTGHHQGNAAARDAVKKEALRKAGIGYHEVVAGNTTPSELKRLVEELVPVGAVD